MRRSCPEGIPLGKTVEPQGSGGSNPSSSAKAMPTGVAFNVMYYTYILRSEKTGSYYYGHSHSPEERLEQHNSGRVRSTKSKIPWKIIYIESFETKSEAYRREFFFKSIDGYHYLKERRIT